MRPTTTAAWIHASYSQRVLLGWTTLARRDATNCVMKTVQNERFGHISCEVVQYALFGRQHLIEMKPCFMSLIQTKHLLTWDNYQTSTWKQTTVKNNASFIEVQFKNTKMNTVDILMNEKKECIFLQLCIA